MRRLVASCISAFSLLIMISCVIGWEKVFGGRGHVGKSESHSSAFRWFQGAVAELNGTVSMIGGIFPDVPGDESAVWYSK
jgi:hypothetical protein